MSSAPNARIRIFDYWQIQQPTIQSQPQRRRTAESALASDVLTQGLMLSSNIGEFLEYKKQYSQQIGKCRKNIRECSQHIHQLCNSQAEEQEKCKEEEKLFKQNLGKLYSELRGSKVILFCLREYFQKANLANYDPNLMQLNYSQSSQSMRQKLDDSLSNIKKKMYKLTEAQEAGPFLGEYSGVFGKEYSSKFCLNALQQQLNHQNLVKIHFLMLYQLQQFSKTVNEFSQFLTISQSQYLKYELVLDCITLMKQEAAQMRNLTKSSQADLEQVCSEPSKFDNHFLAQRQQKRLKLWKQNIVIYQTNLDNFTRANVQTNMVYYTDLKGKFIKQLQIFTEETDLSEERSKCMIYLMDRYSLYEDLKRRVQLGYKIGESDRKLLLNLYNESGAYELPTNCISLQNLKTSILTKIGDFLTDNGIAYNRKVMLSESADFSISRQLKLLKDLQQSLPRASNAYMTKNYKNIKSSLFQLESLRSDKESYMRIENDQDKNISRTVDSTRLALMYAQVMANDKDFESKLQDFELINAEGFKGLPIKFQQALFKYISDINLISQHRKQQLQRSKYLQKFKMNLSQAINKSLQKSNIDVIVEKQAEVLKEMWFNSYNNLLKRVSNYGQDFIFDEIAQLTMNISETIFASSNGIPKLVQTKKMDIEAKLFFTHRILNELLGLIDGSKGDISQFRVIKLDKILEQIFRDLDNNFLSKKLGGKISDIVKLTLLQRYLSKVYGNINLQTAIKTLRKIAYYQSLADIYPTSTDDKNVLLEGLLQLQFKMGELNANFKESDEFQKILDDNVIRLVKEMRRYPLTLAVKHDISGFIAVFRYQSIIDELKAILESVNPKSATKLTIKEIATIYICLQDLKSCKKCSQIHYDSYQNIIVKQRKSIQQYFCRVREQISPRIHSIKESIQSCSDCFLNQKQGISLSLALQSLCRRAS